MKILIILNGISKKKREFYSKILPALQSKFNIIVSETNYAGHAFEIAKNAQQGIVDCVLSAGGDGTLHQVVNGLLANGIKIPLGVIPLGSGNDFATACDLTRSPNSVAKLLEANLPKETDIGKITCLDPAGKAIEKYFINVCSIGMGPTTVQLMDAKPKWLSTDFRYLFSILQTFFSHQPESLELVSEHLTWKGKARVLAIANGKSFGNKIFIAPNASVDDGVLNLFLADDLPLARFLLYLQSIKAKKRIESKHLTYSTGNWFDISSSQRIMIEAEGELVGMLPAKIEVNAKKIGVYR